MLELADGFINIKGLCLYSKYGFRHDSSLVDKKCFKSVENLPMICDFAAAFGTTVPSEVEERISCLFTRTTCPAGFKIDKERTCEARGDVQIMLAMLANVKIGMVHNQDAFTNDPFMFDDNMTVRYTPLIKWAETFGLGSVETILSEPSKHPEVVNGLIKLSQKKPEGSFPAQSDRAIRKLYIKGQHLPEEPKKRPRTPVSRPVRKTRKKSTRK